MCRTARVMIHDQHKSFIVQIQKYRRVRSVSFPCCFWWSVIINPMLNWFASDDERWERHHFTNLLCFRYNSFQLVLYCLERTSQPYICVSESGRDRTWCLCSSCVPPVFLLCSSCVPPPPEESPDWPSVECLGPGWVRPRVPHHHKLPTLLTPPHSRNNSYPAITLSPLSTVAQNWYECRYKEQFQLQQGLYIIYWI